MVGSFLECRQEISDLAKLLACEVQLLVSFPGPRACFTLAYGIFSYVHDA